jgi:hypothetical protein
MTNSVICIRLKALRPRYGGSLVLTGWAGGRSVFRTAAVVGGIEPGRRASCAGDRNDEERLRTSSTVGAYELPIRR